MIKSQEQVLYELEALFTIAQPSNSNEFMRGFTMALLAVAQQWGVAGEFSIYVSRLESGKPLIVLNGKARNDNRS